MGEHFLGSCTVTSRNSLIHNGATNGTKLGRFDPKGEQQGLFSRACHCIEEPFATVNFVEFFFFPRTRVNRVGHCGCARGSQVASSWPCARR
jgi:hypothetical protein